MGGFLASLGGAMAKGAKAYGRFAKERIKERAKGSIPQKPKGMGGPTLAPPPSAEERIGTMDKTPAGSDEEKKKKLMSMLN